MATGGDHAAEELVSVEMPAPEGWTKKVPTAWLGIDASSCFALPTD